MRGAARRGCCSSTSRTRGSSTLPTQSQRQEEPNQPKAFVVPQLWALVFPLDAIPSISAGGSGMAAEPGHG